MNNLLIKVVILKHNFCNFKRKVNSSATIIQVKEHSFDITEFKIVK